MPRKKLSEMTCLERADKILGGRTLEEAEEAGVEILARCMALHVYARKDGEEWFKDVMRRIAERGDQWAHEGNHPTLLAFAAVGYKYEKEQQAKKSN